ncbi:MAG: nucleoside-diphosphate kinase [Chloroflexi bacterium]|nr:nucleoside-diphosphate kinase [Chloroflexota bacterium]
MERTLFIVKPDGVQRGLIGECLSRLERRGLRLVGLKFMQITPELAAKHYAVHLGKSFYEKLIGYITSGPVAVMAWEGPNAIALARQTMGATAPGQAAPGSIRADLAVEIGRNLVHGSDSPETAAFEIGLYFPEDELVSWKRETDKWIFE